MAIVAARFGTPFARVCATGYYDGPLTGWALGRADELYAFACVDADDGQDARVFAVYAVPAELRHDVMQFPGWRSPPRVAVVSPADAERYPHLAVEPEAAWLIAIVVATDLLAGLIAWLPWTAPLPTDHDWLRAFDIPRQGAW